MLGVSRDVRNLALDALLEVEPGGESAVPVLRRLAVKEPQPIWALTALVKFGKTNAQAVNELHDLLLNTEHDVKTRRAVVEVIGNHELQGEAVVKALVEALADADEMVRYHAVIALQKVRARGPEVIAALTVRLREDRHVGVRREAAIALGAIGKEARSAVPALKEVLKDENDLLREYSRRALSHVE